MVGPFWCFWTIYFGHISVELDNIEVLFLPPNTTSKLQPMDAGIIAAFKRRYRRLYIQRAVEIEEAGGTNLYKVDLLTAMQCAKASWNEITANTIHNCFCHTKVSSLSMISQIIHILNAPHEAATAINVAVTDLEAGAIEQEIGEGIQAIGVVTLFDVTNFINPAGENKSSLEELIDEELMKMTTDGSLEDEEEDVAADPSQMSTNEKLHHLTKAMKLLDLSKPSHASCYVVFCTL